MKRPNFKNGKDFQTFHQLKAYVKQMSHMKRLSISLVNRKCKLKSGDSTTQSFVCLKWKTLYWVLTRMWRYWHSCTLLVGIQNGLPALQNIWQFLKMFITHTPYDSRLPALTKYFSKTNERCPYINMHKNFHRNFIFDSSQIRTPKFYHLMLQSKNIKPKRTIINKAGWL